METTVSKLQNRVIELEKQNLRLREHLEDQKQKKIFTKSNKKNRKNNGR